MTRNLPSPSRSENTLPEKIRIFPKIRELKNNVPIKEALAYVYSLVGITTLPDTTASAIIHEFIREQYPDLVAEEIKDAFKMGVTRKLQVDMTHFNNFSCEFLGRVMSAYRSWRQEELRRVSERTSSQKAAPLTKKEDLSWWNNQFFIPYDLYFKEGKYTFRNESWVFMSLQIAGLIDSTKKVFDPEKDNSDDEIKLRKLAFRKWVDGKVNALTSMEDLRTLIHAHVETQYP
jgi:hypothetical protein